MPSPSRLDRLIAGQPAELADTIAASRLLFRAATLLEARIDEALAPLGLAMRDYLALVLIADDAVEPLRPSDLSTTLDATRTQITRLLDGLEKKGLVQRLPAKQDRRSLALTLTPEGAALRRQAAPAVHTAYQGGWTAIGPAGTRHALGLLRRLNAALGPAQPAPGADGPPTAGAGDAP
jgi:MarR family transcriptional repressor of emrRAB